MDFLPIETKPVVDVKTASVSTLLGAGVTALIMTLAGGDAVDKVCSVDLPDKTITIGSKVLPAEAVVVPSCTTGVRDSTGRWKTVTGIDPARRVQMPERTVVDIPGSNDLLGTLPVRQEGTALLIIGGKVVAKADLFFNDEPPSGNAYGVKFTFSYTYNDTTITRW